MYTANSNGMPTPLSTLDDLSDSPATSSKPYKVFIGHNLGYRTFQTLVPIKELYDISEVANEQGVNGEPIAQRKLDSNHAKKLGVFMLKGLIHAAIQRRIIEKKNIPEKFYDIQKLVGEQPYLALQPLVANIRKTDPGGANLPGVKLLTNEQETASFKVFLSQEHVLWIVDGQHRRAGMNYLFDFLEDVTRSQKYPRKGGLIKAPHNNELSESELLLWHEAYEVARTYCTVGVEVHLGLSPEQERQLFHDLNNLGKKVERSLALQFDSSNPINTYIKETLIDDTLGVIDIYEKDVTDWHKDSGGLARKDLVSINALAFLNKTNISGATPAVVEPRQETVTRLWSEICSIEGFGENKAKLNTVTAQPVVLKALAKLTYDYAFNTRKPDNADELLEKLFKGVRTIDFSHENPMWRYYDLTQSQIEEYGLLGLKDYMPSNDEGKNRDIGSYDEVTKVMRFGAKHNDIFPILGDMIRWKLNLPSRHAK
jgi:hypothetical protein